MKLLTALAALTDAIQREGEGSAILRERRAHVHTNRNKKIKRGFRFVLAIHTVTKGKLPLSFRALFSSRISISLRF